MFDHNAPVICINAPPHPTYGDSRGIAGQLLFDCPHSAEELPGLLHWEPYPGEIFYCVGWGLEQGCNHQLVPAVQGLRYTRALKSEKSLSPPIPVGGGAVDTNDWCII